MATIVRCFLPNCSDSINGIAFKACADGGVQSVEELPDEVAEQFRGINGYALIPVDAKEASKPPTPKPSAPAAPSAPIPQTVATKRK